jgi:AraC-like DNA-binding protein
MNNSISFFLPSPELRGSIQNYYIAEFANQDDNETFEQRLLSNGCVEMFIGYQNTRSTCYNSKGDIFNIDSGIVGAHNLENTIKGLSKEPGAKELKFVSINFKQNGFYDIFKIPGSETHNGFLNGNQVLGNDIRFLQEQLGNAKNNLDRIIYIEQYLIGKLYKNINDKYNFKGGLDIASFINDKKGNMRLNDLTNEFRASERTLQRSFKSAMGYSIKEYCKIIRFYNLLDNITYKNDVNWADLVSQCGYYDQPHLINEFHAATGFSPFVFSRNINKNIFRLYNHLAILKSDELFPAMVNGTKSSIEAS